MEKPTLSPQGVEEKVQYLYALSDPALEAEAALISSDLRGWLLENFEVTEAQLFFLNQLSDSYVAALTDQTARAVRHRWPIIFISNAAQMAVTSEKWIRSKEEDEAGSGGGRLASQHTGSLTIETGY